MNLVQKIIVGIIERSCKNYITTIVGVLSVMLFAVNTFGSLIPLKYHDFVNAAAVVLQGVALILAKDSGVDPSKIPTPTKLAAFLLVGLLALGAASTTVQAQVTAPIAGDVIAIGPSYNSAATPNVAGSAFYGHLLTDGTRALVTLDVLPNGTKPFSVSTNIGTGIAQRVATISGYEFWATTGAGLTYTSTNVGWNFQFGAAALKQIKNTHWYAFGGARLQKLSVGVNGYAIAPTTGVMYKF